MAELNPFLLASSTPDPDPRLLPLLRSKPELASRQDAHGYSLLHAAASYNHVELLRVLVNELHANVNLVDEDGETALFIAETVDVAKCLIEELQIDTGVKNEEGQTALEKVEAEEEFPEIAAYIRIQQGVGGTTANCTALPPLPHNVSIVVNTATEGAADGPETQEPDPEFRRRIEELAARENFQTEEGQRELRDLITDAVRGASDDRDVRRRVA
jgi:uncharacterized protein